jgi:hypothetical protein
MKITFSKLLVFLFVFSLFLAIGSISFAQQGFIPDQPSPLSALNEIQSNVGNNLMPSADPILWIVRVFNYLLTFLGVIFIVMIIYGGYTWMTAAGNEEKVKKGKDILQTAIIGLVIVILVRVIYIFVWDRLKEFSSK